MSHNTKKLLIIENNEEKVNLLDNHFKDRLQILSCNQNGEVAYNTIINEKPDYIITELILSEFDGFILMEKISHITNYNPSIIVTSMLTNETFIEKALNSGADYFIAKPYNENILINTLEDYLLPKSYAQMQNSIIKNTKNTKGLDEKITNIFISLGIPAHIKGFQFLREAIKLSIEKPEYINSITKKLYPEIANKFQTTPSKVERAIRHAIEVAWNRGRVDSIDTLFGIKVYSENERPTNGEFIALLADKMLLEITI